MWGPKVVLAIHDAVEAAHFAKIEELRQSINVLQEQAATYEHRLTILERELLRLLEEYG